MKLIAQAHMNEVVELGGKSAQVQSICALLE